LGRTIQFGCQVAIKVCLIVLSKFNSEKQCRISIPQPIQPKPSHAEVDCGVVDECNQVGRTNLACWSQFGYRDPPLNVVFLVEFSWPQNRATIPSPCRFSQSPAISWLIVLCLTIATGWTNQNWLAGCNLAMANPPLNVEFLLNFMATKQSRLSITL
jgi:hypothetical protein